MGQRFTELSTMHMQFVREQHMFFVATAAADGRVNVSPKGLDSFRIVDAKQVAWLNVTGSGNETAAHVLENPRMTIMFCAFEGKPVILRLYGTARVLYPRDEQWQDYASRFELIAGTRQIFVMDVDLVQTSCGMAVPLFDYQGQRQQLVDWAEGKGQAGIEAYWRDKNQLSLDQKPTKIFE
ncbi:MAG: pyridoxamine 5'-phosphate oxidase family protein [Methylophilus sp.]